MVKIHQLDYLDFNLAFLDEPELGATPIEPHINLYERHIDWGLERQRFSPAGYCSQLAACQPVRG